jgi:hypothetical protein
MAATVTPSACTTGLVTGRGVEGEMGTALAIVVGVVAGGFLGYMAGVLVACVLFDAGNLCGLLGALSPVPLARLLVGLHVGCFGGGASLADCARASCPHVGGLE